MTADEWATSTNPEKMLAALDNGGIETTHLPVVLAGRVSRRTPAHPP